ncbi:MAG: dienelactone hydrolase, partial [Rhodobacteraceae bacterium]|nr:dienelactone hydrolase [Paracoccaceae bacterium]
MNRIDATRPDSPALAGPGAYPVGVAAQVIEDPARFDPYTGITGPRLLPAEVWYPANAATVAGVAYHTILRDGLTPVTLHGRACRDAMPAAGRFPLVVISHGYPGNRYLLAHLAEALASQGYVVVAVDHPQSTYDDQGSFGATLYHRPLDQRRVLAAMVGDRRVLPGCSALIG